MVGNGNLTMSRHESSAKACRLPFPTIFRRILPAKSKLSLNTCQIIIFRSDGWKRKSYDEQTRIERESLQASVSNHLSPDFAGEIEAQFEYMPDHYFQI